MLGKKRMFLSLAIAAVMLAGGITAGTQLLIEQPVSASITVEGLGNSPSFNVIDNPFDETTNAHAGASAGYISDQDVYAIDFGKKAEEDTGNAWELSFGKSQTATVGDNTDYVLKMENNYAYDMDIDLVEKTSWAPGRGELGDGVVIKVMNSQGTADTGDDTAQWTLTGAATHNEWTITGTTLTLSNSEQATFYLKVENDDAEVGDWSPNVKLQATSE